VRGTRKWGILKLSGLKPVDFLILDKEKLETSKQRGVKKGQIPEGGRQRAPLLWRFNIEQERTRGENPIHQRGKGKKRPKRKKDETTSEMDKKIPKKCEKGGLTGGGNVDFIYRAT